MDSQPKPLVMYRRNSSDMDMSDTDEETSVPNVVKEFIQKSSDEPKKAKDNNETKRSDSKSNSLDARSRHDYDRDRKRRDYDDRRNRDSDYKDKHKHGDDRHYGDRRRRHSRSRSPRRKSSPDRKHHESRHNRKRSRSPRRSPDPSYFRSKRLERKAARIDALGISLVAEESPDLQGVSLNGVPRVVDARQLPNLVGASGQQRLADQMQKRKLLWGNKSGEKKDNPSADTSWTSATFKGDNDGKMTEKFKRLMGIKDDSAVSAPKAGQSGIKDNANAASIKRQEELFSNMEAQYQVARLATHTHRGIGLGFGTFQVGPR